MKEPPISRRRTSVWIDGSDDEEQEHGAEDEREHLPMTLKSAFQKLKVLRLVTQHGVHHSQVQDWATGDRFKKTKSADQEAFIQEILRSAPLMQQSALALRSLQPHLSTEHVDEAAEILDAATQALHRIKMCTAHTCWYEHVARLKKEVIELSMKREEVLKQWKEARTSYLKEISVLREQARVRGDPQEFLSGHNTDVEFFFEPTATLGPDERKFLAGVLSEKLKMMMETNPKVVRTFDLGQLDKLIHQVESQECIDLRQALRRKTEEVAEAQKALQDWKSHNRHVAPLPQGDSAGKLVGALEKQVQDLRSDVWEGRRALLQLQEKCGSLQSERDELEAAWREESNRSLLQQKELERLEELRQQLQEELETAEAERKRLDGQLVDVQRRAQRLWRERTATHQLERAAMMQPESAPMRQPETGAPPSPPQSEGRTSQRRSRQSMQRTGTMNSVTLELDTAAPDSPGAASCSASRGGRRSSKPTSPKAGSPKAERVAKAQSFSMDAEAPTGEATEEGDARGPKRQLLPLEVEPVAELEEEEAVAASCAGAKRPPKPRLEPLAGAPASEAPLEEGEAEQLPGPRPLPLDAAGSGEAPTEAIEEEGEALAEELQAALAGKEALEARCDELEALLRSHLEALPAQNAEAAHSEAESIAQFAESLGCVSREQISDGVRICSCGNLLTNDASFCRKCGSEWREERAGTKDGGAAPGGRSSKDRILELGHRFAKLDQAHQSAVKQLDLLLRPEQEGGQQGKSAGGGKLAPGEAPSGRPFAAGRPLGARKEVAGAEASAAGKARAASGVCASPEPRAGGGASASGAAGGEAPAVGEARTASEAIGVGQAAASSRAPAAGKALAAAVATDSVAPAGKDVKWAPTVEELEEEVARLEREKSNTEAQILVELAEATLEDGQAEPEDQECNCRAAQNVGVLRQLLGKLRLLCNQLIGKLKSATMENVKMSNALTSSRSLLEVAARAVGESMRQRTGTQDKRLLEGLRAIEGSKSRCVFYRLYSDARQRERRRSLAGAQPPSAAPAVGDAAGKTPDGDQGVHSKAPGTAASSKGDAEKSWENEVQSPASESDGGPLLTITQITKPPPPLTRQSRVSKTLPAGLPVGWSDGPSSSSAPSAGPPLTVLPLRTASPSVQLAPGASTTRDVSPAAKTRAGERPSSRSGTTAGEPSSARAWPSESATTSPRRPSGLVPVAAPRQSTRHRTSMASIGDTRLPRLVTPRKESVAMDSLLVVSSTPGSGCATPCGPLREEPSGKK